MRKILQAFKNFTWRQWLTLFLFFAVLLFTGFYVYRTAQRAFYWRQHQNQPLADWMSIGYVAHSYHVPPPVLYDAIGLKPEAPHDRRSLAQIAKIQNRSTGEIKTELEKAIADFRTQNPPATGGNP